MSNKIKSILCFLTGSIIGGAAGVLGTKTYFQKKYEKKADAEIQEMSEYYDKRVEELVKVTSEPEEKEFKEPETPLTKEQKEEIKEKLTRNFEQTTNYAKMYKQGLEPGDLTEEELAALREQLMEDQTMEKLGEEATRDHQANRNRPPRIISESALGEIPAYYDHQVLLFYRLDDTLTDEDDEIIDDPDYLLGDCLDKYNFRESKERLLFVQNFALDTIYEVQKFDMAFGDD